MKAITFIPLAGMAIVFVVIRILISIDRKKSITETKIVNDRFNSNYDCATHKSIRREIIEFKSKNPIGLLKGIQHDYICANLSWAEKHLQSHTIDTAKQFSNVICTGIMPSD